MAVTGLLIGGLVLGGASLGLGISNTASGNKAAAQAARLQAAAAAKQSSIAQAQSASQAEYAGQEYGLQVQGAQQSLAASQASAAINKNIIGLEQQVQDQQRVAMQVSSHRQAMETIRTQQRARAIALTAGTANGGQGAQRSSAISGAYGQAQGQSGVNLLGINQSLQRGEQLYSLAGQITQQKIGAIDLESQYAAQQAALTTQRSQMMYQYAQVNADYNSQMARAGGQISLGQGLINAAQGQIASGGMYMGAGSSIFNAGMSLGKIFAPKVESQAQQGELYAGDPTLPGFGPFRDQQQLPSTVQYPY